MPENKLQIIVKKSGLEGIKAETILTKFQDYFDMAARWEIKARTLVVTNAIQVADMQMARTGRLFLMKKRTDIERTRKAMKEQSLRESRAIDGIANVLKALIVPIEEYLFKQENFVKIKEENAREAKRLEDERKAEEERIAQEQAEAAEQERIRVENEKLKKKTIVLERKLAREKKAQEAKLKAQQAKADAERQILEEKNRAERECAEEIRKAQEAKAQKEREKAEKERVAREAKVAKEKAEAEKKARKEREESEAKAEAERKEKERLAEILKNQVECPKCHFKFQLKGDKNGL